MSSVRNTAFDSQSKSSLFGVLLALIAVLYLSISPLGLEAMGFNYGETGGSPLEKLHPATLLVAGALLLACLSNRRPIEAAFESLAANPGATVFLVAIGLLIAHAIRVVHIPFTLFIDTFLAPVMIFFLFKDIRGGRLAKLTWLVHLFFAANATLGLFEVSTGFRLTPLIANGIVLDDWRASAFLGHPLANASITGAYLLILAAGGGRTLPPLLTALLFALNMAAMIVFGGRASFVLVLVMLAVEGGVRFFSILNGGRFDKRRVLVILIVVPSLAIGLGVLAEAGFFDQFIERFFDDDGSASTRIVMFDLFQHMRWSDLLFAPDSAQVQTYQYLYGLEFGIESFWVSFVLSFGIVPGVVFFTAMLFFVRDLVRNTATGAIWVIFFFFAVASTSLSLSAKSPVLAILVLVTLILMPANSQAAQDRKKTLQKTYVPQHYAAA